MTFTFVINVTHTHFQKPFKICLYGPRPLSRNALISRFVELIQLNSLDATCASSDIISWWSQHCQRRRRIAHTLPINPYVVQLLHIHRVVKVILNSKTQHFNSWCALFPQCCISTTVSQLTQAADVCKRWSSHIPVFQVSNAWCEP